MNVTIGKSYHISNSFYALVQDPYLMVNKEGNHYRPHFFFFADPATPGIFWAIPQSTRVEKYSALAEQKRRKYGKCNTILIGDFGGRSNAFLIQNMFPIIEKYVEYEHTINGIGVKIHQKLTEELISNAKEVLALHHKGYKVLYPDVKRIYSIMKTELEKQ